MKISRAVSLLACTMFLTFPGLSFGLSFSNYSSGFDLNDIATKKMLDAQKSTQGFDKDYEQPNASNSVDPDHYLIGGGDEFFISVVGIPSEIYTVKVNSQGDLYIPDLGLLKLGKIKLSECLKRIRDFVQTKLKKNGEIYVTLTKVKTATVTINGGIGNPGTYVFSGEYRILDVFRAVNNNFLPSLNEFDYRDVQIKNKDSTATIDLFEYLMKNDISRNPYIYPGDNITLEFATKKVILNSLSKNLVSGNIPIKENENLSNFLYFFKFDKSVDTETILLQSSSPSGERFSRAVDRRNMDSVFLHNRDIITIPQKKNYTQIIMITISGEIARPGVYPILEDSTTVTDLIAMAGGTTQFANLKRAIIARRGKILGEITHGSKINWETNYDGKSPSASSIQQISAMAASRPEMFAGLSKMNTMNDYSIIQLNKQGLSVKLISNDELIIPRKESFVYVSGNVKQPGAFAYVDQKPFKYYIAQAGGFTDKADRGNLFGVRTFFEISQITDLSEIIEGDIIVVPDSQPAKMLSTIYLPVFQALLTMASIVLAIYTVSKR